MAARKLRIRVVEFTTYGENAVLVIEGGRDANLTISAPARVRLPRALLPEDARPGDAYEVEGLRLLTKAAVPEDGRLRIA